MQVVKLLYDMAFVKRTAKCDRAFLSTGSYISVVKKLIPANPSINNHEMSVVHTESIDSACTMQIDEYSFADTNEGATTNTYINS